MYDEFGAEYLITVLLWLASLAFLLGRAWSGRRPVTGLCLAYWVNLAMIHLLSGLIQFLPWHTSRDRAFTLLGFSLTGYAMAGFVAGHFIPKRRPSGGQRGVPGASGGSYAVTAGNAIWFGLACYFVVSGLAAIIPSAGAIISNGLNVCVAGFCLLFWSYYKEGERQTALWMMSFALIMPAMTLMLRGFLGYGICAMVAVGAFVAVKYAPRRTVVIGGLLAGFVGLSLYISYMAVRSEIRASVWGEEALADRFLATRSLERNWTWVDVGSSKQLASIESRLNQNALVGAARSNIEFGNVALANGETIWQAFLALIPRIIWPGKPFYAGSGGLVTRFTGIRFAEGTSVGIGHVMELYINFGTFGVFVGFAVIGFVLSFADERAGQHLQVGNVEGFLVWYVTGETLLTVNGTFSESFPAAVGSVILCLFLSRMISTNGLPAR